MSHPRALFLISAQILLNKKSIIIRREYIVACQAHSALVNKVYYIILARIFHCNGLSVSICLVKILRNLETKGLMTQVSSQPGAKAAFF